MVMDKSIKLNFDENVLFYEIEKNDDFDLEALSEEEQTEIEAKNTKFMNEVIEPEIKKVFGICNCQMGDYVQRMERLRAIQNIPPQQYNPVIDQQEFDKFTYAVIVVSENGLMTGISAFMRSCKFCHKLDYWGDIEIFAHMVAEITTNFVSAKSNDPLGLGIDGYEAEEIGDEEGEPDQNDEEESVGDPTAVVEQPAEEPEEIETTEENPLGDDVILTDIPQTEMTSGENLSMEPLDDTKDEVKEETKEEE